jgi:hypothetical protein
MYIVTREEINFSSEGPQNIKSITFVGHISSPLAFIKNSRRPLRVLLASALNMLINEEERKKKENSRSSEKNGADEKESQLSWCDVKWKLGEKCWGIPAPPCADRGCTDSCSREGKAH